MARIAFIAKLALCLFVFFSVVGWFGGLIAEFQFEAGERTTRYWIGFACAIVIVGVPYFLAMYISSQGLRRLKSLREKIQQPLLARSDCNEESFYHQFPDIDRELLAGIRVAIAKTLDVPLSKIWPKDNPQKDYGFEQPELFIEISIVNSLLSARNRTHRGLPCHWGNSVMNFRQLVENLLREIANSVEIPSGRGGTAE